MNATHLRLQVVTVGGHVHVALWAGVPGYTFGKCGDLCFTVAEWPLLRELFSRQRIEIVELVTASHATHT